MAAQPHNVHVPRMNDAPQCIEPEKTGKGRGFVEFHGEVEGRQHVQHGIICFIRQLQDLNILKYTCHNPSGFSYA